MQNIDKSYAHVNGSIICYVIIKNVQACPYIWYIAKVNIYFVVKRRTIQIDCVFATIK